MTLAILRLSMWGVVPDGGIGGRFGADGLAVRKTVLLQKIWQTGAVAHVPYHRIHPGRDHRSGGDHQLRRQRVRCRSQPVAESGAVPVRVCDTDLSATRPDSGLAASGLLDRLDPANLLADRGHQGSGMITPVKKPRTASCASPTTTATPHVNRLRGVHSPVGLRGHESTFRSGSGPDSNPTHLSRSFTCSTGRG